jgi:hypothetical protein
VRGPAPPGLLVGSCLPRLSLDTPRACAPLYVLLTSPRASAALSTHARAHTRARAHTHARTRARTRTHTRTHAHAHTRTHNSSTHRARGAAPRWPSSGSWSRTCRRSWCRCGARRVEESPGTLSAGTGIVAAEEGCQWPLQAPFLVLPVARRPCVLAIARPPASARPHRAPRPHACLPRLLTAAAPPTSPPSSHPPPLLLNRP